MQKSLFGTQWQGLAATITSPPYFDLKDYGARGQLGTGQTYEEYLDDLTGIFAKIYTLTNDNGAFWLVCNSFTLRGEVVLLPFDLSQRMKKVGWKLKDVIIWEKDRNLPWSNGRLRNVFEYILLFSKNEFKIRDEAIREFDPGNFHSWWVRYPERYSPVGVAPTDVWKIGIPVQGAWRHRKINHYHLCPFPVELVRRMLLLTTERGDIVLDPFAGSGTVLAVADCMERHYIGFEIQNEYVRRYNTTLRREVESTLQRLARMESESRDFSSTIMKLRLVKLPRVLANSLQKQLRKSELQCIVAFERPRSKDAPTHKLLGQDILLVVNSASRRRMDAMESSAQALLAEPPLSKYGIEARANVITMDELVNRLSNSSRRWMWMYGRKSYSYERRISIKEIRRGHALSGSSVTKPPLISTTRVRCVTPRLLKF
jgi:DNA modification methylase